jgi:hypothetical protein
MKKIIDFELPIETKSEANISEHWSKRRKRYKIQELQIFSAFNNHFNRGYFCSSPKEQIKLPCEVVMTRISPRTLDEEDNLRMAFKHIKDCIADFIRPGFAPGRADDTEEIAWIYRQTKGNPRQKGIRIEIYC